MEFNTQICTTREQSERLLAMGLKPETADMILWNAGGEWKPDAYPYIEYVKALKNIRKENIEEYCTPAWTLHRLIKFLPHVYGEYWELHNSYLWYYNHHKDLAEEFNGDGLYDVIIGCLEWLVNNGLFNQNTE